MFNGHNANTSVVALTVSKSGVVVVTSNSTEYYLSNPYSPLGISGTANGVAFTFLYTSYTPLPSTLSVGGSGPLSSGRLLQCRERRYWLPHSDVHSNRR
jgi:hypothetical protein